MGLESHYILFLFKFLHSVPTFLEARLYVTFVLVLWRTDELCRLCPMSADLDSKPCNNTWIQLMNG